MGNKFLAIAMSIAFEGTAYAVGSDSSLEEVTVTAQVLKTEAALAETPQSVSVIDRGQLDALGVNSVQEALRYIPSVQAEYAGRTGYEEFMIRGFSQSAYQYRDGLRLEGSYNTQQEPFGLERIEVLQGPASVLYGQISPGGLVNSVSKLPTKQDFVAAKLTVGSFGYVSPAVDAGGSLNSSGTWSFRLPALYRYNDDPIDHVFAERSFVAPALTWQPSDETSLTVLSFYQRDRFQRGVSLPTDGTILPNPNGKISSWTFVGEPALGAYHHEQKSLGYIFSQRIGAWWTFTSRAREFDYNIHGPITSNNGLEADQRTLDRGVVDIRTLDTHAFSMDNQLAGVIRTGRLEHRILVGIDYLRNQASDAYYFFDLPAIDVFAPTYGYTVTATGPLNVDSTTVVTQVHPYAQYRLKLDEHWVAVAGAGHGDTKTDRRADVRHIEKAAKTIGNAALMYLTSGGLSPYVSYSQSFEPQFGYDPQANGFLAPPTEGTQWEAGLKYAPAHGNLSGTIAVFRIRLKNIVEETQRTDGSYYSRVAGVQENRGVDLEMAARLAEHLRLNAGYAYLDAKIIASDIGLVGQRPSDVPRSAFSLVATMDGGAWGWADADVLIGVRNQGERPGPAHTDRVPGYTAVDLGAHYRWRKLQFALNVKNLLNREYFSAYYDGVNPGDPRTVQASVQLTY